MKVTATPCSETTNQVEVLLASLIQKHMRKLANQETDLYQKELMIKTKK